MKALSILPLIPLLATALAAQQVRHFVETTNQGVFVRSETAALPTPLANPNPSPSGLRWTYNNPTGTPWITSSVSVGNGGAWAWLGQNLNGRRISLLSTTENNAPPIPIFEVLTPTATGLAVAAAKAGAGCAVAHQNSTGLPEIQYYVGTSPTPLWTLPVTIGSGPFLVRTSANGAFVAAGYNDPSGVATVQVHAALSPTPRVPIAVRQVTSHGLRNFDLSGDGLKILFASNTRDHLVDVLTGVELHSVSTVSVDAHAVNFNGTTFGRGGFDVGAWREVNGVWTQVLNFRDNTLSFGIYTACDVSADGSTFVVAATDASNNYLPFRVYCWTLTNTGATLNWTYSVTGTGPYQDTPQSVSVSDDGKWIAVSSWGDGAGSHPEVMLFDRDAGNTPVAVIDTPGSAFDSDLSADGQFVVAGTKAVHANTFGNGGAGYSLDRGGQGLVLRGTVSLTRSVGLELRGGVNHIAFLLVGVGVTGPVTVPGFTGSLRIHLASPFIGPLSLGPIPAAGLISVPLTIPNDPTLLGASLYAQSLRVTPAGGEFDNFVPLPFTP